MQTAPVGLLGFPQYVPNGQPMGTPISDNAWVPGVPVQPPTAAPAPASPSFAHVSPEFAQYIPGIFAGESGGDYNALFGFSNRPGGQFSNVRLTDMTVGEALAFADPSGPYGQWVAGQVGRVATPMGAYQVVGTTLRAAMQGLGLTGNERMTPELQDRIGQWIFENQGIGAWEGFQAGVTELATPDPNARAPQGQGNMPQGLLSPTMSTMNAPEPRSQGLLAPLWDRLSGVPVLGRLADEETRLRLASGLAGLSTRPNQGLIQNAQAQLEEIDRTERLNQTVAYLNSIGRADLAAAIVAGLPAADALAAAVAPDQPVQARMSQILEDGTIIQSTDAGPRVFSAAGDELTGQAAIDAIAEANRQRVENERAVYEGRRAGTLDAEVDMGRDANREMAAGTVEGQTEAERVASAPSDMRAAETALQDIDALRNHPALANNGNPIQNFVDGGVGMSSFANARPGSAGYDLQQRVEQLGAGAFLTAIDQLRGMGALSNTEGETARRAITRLNTGLSEQDFLAALADYERIVRSGYERAQRIANGEVATVPLEAVPPSSDEIQSLLDRYAPVQ